MNVCRVEDYKQLILSYDSCFSTFYPDLNFYCDDEIFTVKGIIRKYTDISGVDLNMDYFIIAMKKEYLICLPISETAKYQIKNNNSQLKN